MRKCVATAIIIGALLLISSSAIALDPWAEPLENVYWGDLHVHTNYSLDAFLSGMSPGRYVDEAGQYALYCSRLDFYAVADHADLLIDTNYWPETIRSARHFNRIGRSADLKNPRPADVEAMINPQDGSVPKSLLEIRDLSYSDPAEPDSYCQERAWTSPFYMTRP